MSAPPPNTLPSPQPKHVCSRNQACSIPLFDIGKTYHSFPISTFQAQYFSPTIPKQFINSFIKSPPAWNWHLKAGSNTGKAICIPTIPTPATHTAPSLDWFCASLFFSFKDLSPKSLHDGHVPQPLLQVYINNMVLHFKNSANSFIIASQAKYLIAPSTGTQPLSFANCLTSHLPLTSESSKDALISQLCSQVSQLNQCLASLEVSALLLCSPIPSALPFQPPNPTLPSSSTVQSVAAIMQSLSPLLLPITLASLDEWAAALPIPEHLNHGSPQEAFELMSDVLPLSTDDLILCSCSIYHPLSHSVPTSSHILHTIMAALHDLIPS